MLRILSILILTLNLNHSVMAKELDYFLMLKYNKVNVRYGPDRDDQIKFVYKKKKSSFKNNR